MGCFDFNNSSIDHCFVGQTAARRVFDIQKYFGQGVFYMVAVAVVMGHV
jgi:hypothetical protein